MGEGSSSVISGLSRSRSNSRDMLMNKSYGNGIGLINKKDYSRPHSEMEETLEY